MVIFLQGAVFNKPSSHRDAVIVTTMDTFTSLLGGVTIFAILGNLAHNMGIKDISKVVKSGSGLAFISYPDAISKIDWVPQVKAKKEKKKDLTSIANK